MNEVEAFEQVLKSECEKTGYLFEGCYPLYRLSDGLSNLNIRIITPFQEAEIENVRKIKNASPSKILESATKEFRKLSGKKSTETDLIRFSKVLLLCAQELILLLSPSLKMLKIKKLLEVVKKNYAVFKIEVDELDMFSKAVNSNLVDVKLFPGRNPCDLIEIIGPDGVKKRYTLVQFQRFELIRDAK